MTMNLGSRLHFFVRDLYMSMHNVGDDNVHHIPDGDRNSQEKFFCGKWCLSH